MNDIHPTALVGKGVELGDGNVIGPYAVLMGPMEMGDDNWVASHVVLGTVSEWSADKGAAAIARRHQAGLRIGNSNVFREYVTAEQGTDGPTVVGDECYVMFGARVPHDGHIEDRVTLACHTVVGGHGTVRRGANIGLGAIVHQGLTVGPLAMVGMQAAVTGDVPPFALMMGVPARVRGANVVGMTRAGVSEVDAAAVDASYRAGNFDDPVVTRVLDFLSRPST